MSSQYTDPRDFILHIKGELISEYLKTCHRLDFPAGAKNEKREDCADRFIDFIYEQDEDLRNRVFMELEYVNSLSSERHIAALCDNALNINREKDIEEHASNNDERALVAFIKFPSEFDNYFTRANLETIAVKELTLPQTVPTAEINDADKIAAFEKGIQAIYHKSLKGRKCKVKIISDDRNLLLRAYLEDLPTRDTVFDGDTLDEKHIRKPVFDAVFIYKEELSMLGVRALGGKDIVSALQKLFCSHFLGIDDIDTDEQLYKLPPVKSLISLNLVANASYGVERCYLKSIRLENSGIPHKLFIDVGGRDQYSGTDAIKRILSDLGLDVNSGWQPTSIKITVVFKQIGKGRRKQVTVTITPPNTCDLKNREQDDIVRKLLHDWGLHVE